MTKRRSTEIPYKNRSNKLTQSMVSDLCKLYIEGCGLSWLGRKFKIDHSSIAYYVKKFNLTQNKKLTNEEFLKKYKPNNVRNNTKQNMTHSVYKTYQERQQDSTRKAISTLHDTECSHKYWIKRCSMCNGILESDCHINTAPELIELDVYNDFNTIVCSYKLATELKQLKVKQQSVIYWVYYIDMTLLQLKCKKNLPDKHDKSTLVFAAFSIQELFAEIFNRKTLKNAELLRLIKVSNTPDDVAQLLIDILKDRQL